MKAMSQSVLVAVLIALVVGLVLFMLTYQMISKGKAKSDEEQCRFSLEHVKLSKFPIPTPEIRCPYKPKKFSVAEDQTITGISEELRHCWFKTYGKDSTIASDKGADAVCIVCGEFTVTDIISTDKLLEFMKITKMPNPLSTMSKEDVTYAQYIDTDWGNPYSIVKTVPIGDEQLFITLESEGRLQTISSFFPGDTYFVIKLNIKETGSIKNYNHVMIVRGTDVPSLKCDFQRERI